VGAVLRARNPVPDTVFDQQSEISFSRSLSFADMRITRRKVGKLRKAIIKLFQRRNNE
jgi:hypothetical protein